MAHSVSAGNNKVHVNPVDYTCMTSEDDSRTENIPSPQRESHNDRLNEYFREQGAHTKCMLICMAVLLPVCISSAGVLVWHTNRTADALSKLQMSVDQQKVGDQDALPEKVVSLQDSLKSELAERLEQVHNNTDVSAKMMMDFILEVADTNRMPQDCVDFLRYGFTSSGMYRIYPSGGPQTGNDVWCDMQTDGGGWIVIQRRQNGTVDFYRDWQSYKLGFGEPADEFWIGNDVLHRLTSCSGLQLRVDLWSWENETAYAEYSSFTIEGESSNYILRLGTYIGGNASDAMGFQNGMPFSTFDRDNDPAGTRNCAAHFVGAWWYKACHHSNLNGLYSINPSVTDGMGINWKQWKGLGYSLMKTEMKLRRA